MFNRLRPKSEFTRHVLTLMTGTTIAQAIPIAISPILTRIYTPEEFGVFALYISIASIVSVLATGRYELAILLPKKDTDAANIVLLSFIISLVISLLTLITITLFHQQIVGLLGNASLSKWLYAIPITIMLTGLYQSFNYWNNRKKHYKRMSVNRVVRNGTVATSNLVMGVNSFGSGGLIMSNIIGQFFATILLGRAIYKDDSELFKNLKILKVIALAKKYRKFPQFDLTASLISTFSSQLILILFNILFTSTIAGLYYLTQKVVALPISIVAQSIGEVFKQKASEDFRKYNNAKQIYISTFNKLFMLAILPSIFLYLFSVEIFTYIFGEKWDVAGKLVEIMIPMLFFKFISSPLSFMLYIGEKQHINLYNQILFLLAITISFLFGNDIYEILTYVTILFSGIYLYYLYLSAKIAKVF